MIDFATPPPTDELPAFDPERGLQDPRTIHPSPDDIFDDPAMPAVDESADRSDAPPREEGSPVAASPGIVDPRSEPAGPDI
ncbi:hypothetical protein OJF2_47280 [Aquisphaera giovannonii]|uniref:Uncharacterized protein n=1 Tax=Aquisphaera giovannonii TaxID=406548 RepID=A0A5B9W6J5_9BACT|nr:hypothetical protein [Aquisphaera giovannonii]QEH36168.1 hypothetical protein OJF2_47280 [Aquisphaera giovannonii]